LGAGRVTPLVPFIALANYFAVPPLPPLPLPQMPDKPPGAARLTAIAASCTQYRPAGR